MNDTTTVKAEPVVTLTLRHASDYDRTHYGLVFESVETVDVTGPAAHSRHYPHRAQVWTRPECTGTPYHRVLHAESIIIALHPVELSPNVGTVREGDVVRLLYPDGTNADLTVTKLWLQDPALA